MLRRFLIIVLLVAVFSPGWLAAEDSSSAGEWRPLFNGKDLDGWIVKIAGHAPGDNYGNTFRVEDGILKVVYDQYEQFDERYGHLFYETPFSHYILRVEYRFVGQQVPGGAGWAWRNSGIMVHGQAPETMEKDQPFPTSIEVQLLGGRETGERSTGNLCTPGTHVVMDGKLFAPHCTNSKSKTYRGDQWVTIEVEVRGSQLIRHIIDGQTILEYSQPQLDETDQYGRQLIKDGQKLLEKGTISLQSESHPVQFRKVEIRELTE